MKNSLYVFCWIALFSPVLVHAQAVTDGTVGPIQSLSGQFVVPASLGTVSGGNLFHSFKAFNVNTGESATFTGSSTIQNVVTRVTGGEISTINGLLRSQVGNADFYFINPAGIVFGKNAQLDVPAAFYASTADNLRFKDGKIFSASHPQDNSLSVSIPEAFGLLDSSVGNNGLLDINGAHLTVRPGQNLDLQAENINIHNLAQLSAPEGHIHLTALQGKQLFNLVDGPTLAANSSGGSIKISDSVLNSDGNGRGALTVWGHDFQLLNSVLSAANTGLRNSTSVDGIFLSAFQLVMDKSNVLANAYDRGNAGNIRISSNNATLSNSVHVASDSYGKGSGGSINVINTELFSIQSGAQITAHSNAVGNGGVININTGTLNLDGKNLNTFTGIAANANKDSVGQAGLVNVNSGTMTINGGAEIASSTFGAGNANAVNINTQHLTIDGQNNPYGQTGIASNANPGSKGQAGDITVATNTLNLINGGEVTSTTFAAGNAGSVKISAQTIDINGLNNRVSLTGIGSDSNSSGNAGQVNVTTQQLTIENAGVIGSNTWGNGQGGQVKVQANNLNISGKNSADDLFTGISSNSLQGNGNAGNVVINADSITLTEKGRIASNTLSNGNGGEVLIQAKLLTIDGNNSSFYTGVSSNTTSKGNAGSVNVNSTQLDIANAGRITTNTRGLGRAGSLVVNADEINIDAKNSVYLAGIASAASPESGGQVGNIDISAKDKIVLNNGGEINIKNRAQIDHPELVKPGYIAISTYDLTLQNSHITAQSTGNIDASNIRMQIAHSLELDPSTISTEANSGNGGSINIDSGSYIDMQQSSISTSVASASGNGGNINLSTPNLVLDNGAVQANAQSGNGGDVFLDTVTLIASESLLQQGGLIPISWKSGTPGFNIIQAASEFGLSGTVNVTSPQLNLSGILIGLVTPQFDPSILRQDYCAIGGEGSSLTRHGYGALGPKHADLLY